MLLLIDNYDSFTYNLYQYFAELGIEVNVVRNDKISLAQIEVLKPEYIVVSPGPGTPRDAGISSNVIQRFGPELPVLGVCLGHQCFGEAYGATVGRAPVIMHGKSSPVRHLGTGLFLGLPNPFTAIRYHSLTVYRESVPDTLEITAWTEDGVVMGLRHKEYPVTGIQFHPESFMTEYGKEIEEFSGAGVMIQEAIAILVEDRDLDEATAAMAMTDIMSGAATSAQIGAFITALRIKGETVAEITGLARTMRVNALKVDTPLKVVDNCGTGGDASGTFNISTGAALVAAAAGAVVAKHGNRAMSSRCGSADVLEGLGVRIDLEAAGVVRCLEQVGIGFMFAPVFHPAMKYAGPPRREIGIRTVFNILGPLTNPAGATAQVLGVADAALVPKLAAVLCALGSERVLVVHGADGLDEISLCAETSVCEVRDGEILGYTLSPEELGLMRVDPAALRGGSLEDNVKILWDVLNGTPGAPRDAVLLNTAAVLLVAGVVADLAQGIAVAADAVDTGRARETLEHFTRLSQGLAGEAT